jgi:hypothetical protein
LEPENLVCCRAIAEDSFDEHDLANLRDEIINIAKSNRIRLLMEMKDFDILLTKGARVFMSSDEKSIQHTIAEAVVIRSTTSKILYNLMTRIYPPKFPFKAFNDEDEARRWLSEFS